ncbi:tripeptidyl peptidase a [Coniochaeta sp. 2T2.1]|nr:tripeptidyl peptidase a [Coniochaeta sp. 2T2.1]
MGFRRFAAIACAALAVTPGALGGVHEKLAVVPHGWAEAKSPVDSVTATFTIALQREFEGLEQHLLDLSTPGSPNYGKWLDRDAVEALYPPPANASSKVVEWLRQNGISNYKVDGAFIDFSAPVETVNTALDASYQLYRNSGVTKLRTLSYSIPDDLQSFVAFVDPGTFFGRVPGPRVLAPTKTKRAPTPSNTTVDASCQTSITPKCLHQLYNIAGYQADPKSGSRLGFGSFLNESALYSDLAEYERFFGIPSQNFTKVLIANGTDDQDASHGNFGEANLDVQNLVGVARPLPVTEFITGGSPPFIPTLGQPTPADNQNEPYVPYYRFLLSKTNDELPQVISNSYGDQEDGVPLDYAKLTCNLVGLLGLRGITTIFSSGDGGLGGSCLAADFKTVQFGSVFPASCPYLTSIGGTSNSTPEVAWDGSSGGFSNYFEQPPWQKATIDNHIKTQVSNETYSYYGQYTNWKGRASPDISAHSLDPYFQVIYDGKPDGSGGTSASAPVVAGIVGLLNDARLRAGKPALGWLNPLIYGVAKDTFVDITGGYTTGCDSRTSGAGHVPWARWNATVGWDPTTGFGTPDFQKLKDLVLGI